MCLNHVLKIAIKNPRPFIRQGDYLEKWAVPLANARDLAHEYSTPSGHAMAAAAFYSCLYGAVQNRLVRIAAVAAILLTGLSRPYLGVHYVGDILLGWAIGLGVGLLALIHGERIGSWWNNRTYMHRVAMTVSASLVFWAATIVINGWQIDSQPRAFLGYAGTVTGLVIARPLEVKLVDFDPKSLSAPCKMLRYVVSVTLAIAALVGLEKFFLVVADNYSLIGYGLQYIRYIVVTVVIIFIAPWLFMRVGLAQKQA
jgi:hypothetical protein